MKVVDLFSKRQKRLRGELPDIYTYDNIPAPLRAQIVHIWRDAIGQEQEADYTPCAKAYRAIYEALCREYGVFSLTGAVVFSYGTSLGSFFLSCGELDKVLDVIELSFQAIDQVIRDNHEFRPYTSLSADGAINELNFRFKEHGVGYQFESGQLVRVDSQILHSHVVKPTLQLLTERTYKGANEEFLKAHEHYRKGRYEECLNECLKAFESTMKAICAKRGWPYRQNDTASKLINTCFANGLIPSFLQSEFAALRSVLESGVPTARNKLSGHGRGTQQRRLPGHFTGYVLYMTAANILFLIESEKELP